jgi:hypothetical protein
MDLTAAISNYQQSQLMGDVQVAVAKRIMDVQWADGATALELLNAAAKAGEMAGDSLVAAATGFGSQLDMYG